MKIKAFFHFTRCSLRNNYYYLCSLLMILSKVQTNSTASFYHQFQMHLVSLASLGLACSIMWVHISKPRALDIIVLDVSLKLPVFVHTGSPLVGQYAPLLYWSYLIYSSEIHFLLFLGVKHLWISLAVSPLCRDSLCFFSTYSTVPLVLKSLSSVPSLGFICSASWPLPWFVGHFLNF